MLGKVTKRSVDALKPSPAGDLFLWDRELKGFGVRVKPSGAKAFLVTYYVRGLHNVRRRHTLKHHGTLSVDQARRKAKAILNRVDEGADPAREESEGKRAAREDTVEKLFAAYQAEGVGRRKARTIELYESLGRLYLLPALGRLPVARVTARDVADLHRSLSKKPVTANRVVRLVRSFFYWLARRNVVTGQNPARHIEWFPEQSRERFLTVEEMARLGQALRIAETTGLAPAAQHARHTGRKKAAGTRRARNSGMFSSELQPANPVAVSALRFLMLTGWREREALTLRWSDVDLARGFATLMDTKSRKSVRSLGAPARELLAAQPRVHGSPYVFPGRDPVKPLRELQRLWYAARAHAGLDDVRLHDLRHSVASFAGGQGYSLFLIGKLLGHKDQRSTERYAHLADDMRRTMADDVGEGIRAAMGADPHVLPLHGKRSGSARRARSVPARVATR